MFRLLQWLMPSWALTTCPDPSHSHGRRLTGRYKKKQQIVKNLWLASGVIMVIFPVLPFIFAASLFTTFLSFVILDETS